MYPLRYPLCYRGTQWTAYKLRYSIIVCPCIVTIIDIIFISHKYSICCFLLQDVSLTMCICCFNKGPVRHISRLTLTLEISQDTFWCWGECVHDDMYISPLNCYVHDTHHHVHSPRQIRSSAKVGGFTPNVGEMNASAGVNAHDDIYATQAWLVPWRERNLPASSI